MNFKTQLEDDVSKVFYNEDEFAGPAAYIDALSVSHTISVMPDRIEWEGQLVDVYKTPSTMTFSTKGQLTVGTTTYPIIATDPFNGETVLILGDAL